METLTMADGTKVIRLEDHNKTMANVRTNATKGYVHTNDETYKNDMLALKEFRGQKSASELKGKVTELKFGIKADQYDNVVKLAGIDNSMDKADIRVKLKDFSSKETNKVFFQEEEDPTIPKENPPKKNNVIEASGGGTFWDRFKK